MKDKIMKHYRDELEDIVSYADMARVSNSAEACIFRDIAKEESEHATMLKHLLEKLGAYEQTEELMKLEQEAKDALKSV